ncbi:MAG: DNA translocase FtsK [Firmicutes bacterium]|nr:DNA translocase FtsK [Bacillota bacterium]
MAKRKETARLKFDIIGIILIITSLYLFISLLGGDSGIVGIYIKKTMRGIFGLGSFIFPIIPLIYGIGIFYLKDSFKINTKFYSICITFINLLILLHLLNIDTINHDTAGYLDNIIMSYEFGMLGIGGGVIGTSFGYLLIKYAGIGGTIAIITGLLIIAVILFTNTSMKLLIDSIKNFFVSMAKPLKRHKKSCVKKEKVIKEKADIKHNGNEIANKEKGIKIINFTKGFDGGIQENNVENKGKVDEESNKKHDESISPKIKHFPNYMLPNTDILFLPKDSKNTNMKKEIMQNIKILDDTLKSFNVNANVTQVSIGPTITRYELQLMPGVKVSKIVNLADDLSLSLASKGIRIEAPIPGKAAVGIEVPNREITNVYIREVLESDDFRRNKSKISFALGRDVAGSNIIADVGKMPHLLIAGSTGSGKSVCINSLISSILFKANPDEVKMLLIDPKVVELSVYNGIPHLLVPVVTDPKKAAGALNWAVQEMTDRYKLFAGKNVRDIKGYNNSVSEEKEKLPQIIIIIDELSDLMMVAPNEVEDAICRLAQMARAAGLHLVVATQRPSVDVITGLIKANIPSRISFAVSSQTDSRTILDMGGAEKLLGKGDMLFYPVGESKPLRVQGSFILQKEIESLVSFIKEQVPPSYIEDIVLESGETFTESIEADELLNEAADMVVEAGQASILMLQRRLRIGYNRAARIIDQLEERNIIGGFEGSKPRKVLISKEQWHKMSQ